MVNENMDGLTDKQQAVLLMASSICISIGSVTLVTSNPVVGAVITIIGAVGFGLKEALGGKAS